MKSFGVRVCGVREAAGTGTGPTMPDLLPEENIKGAGSAAFSEGRFPDENTLAVMVTAVEAALPLNDGLDVDKASLDARLLPVEMFENDEAAEGSETPPPPSREELSETEAVRVSRFGRPFFSLIRSISSSISLPIVLESSSMLSFAATDLSANASKMRCFSARRSVILSSIVSSQRSL